MRSGTVLAYVYCVKTFLDRETPQLFTPEEIARAAGVPAARVRSLLEAAPGADAFVSETEAVRLVVSLRPRVEAVPYEGLEPESETGLFAAQARAHRSTGAAATVSGAIHGIFLVTALAVAGFGLDASVVATTVERLEPLRLVYLVRPGPGGGGGGGGLRQRLPAPKAELKGRARTSSPVPVRLPVPVEAPAPKPPEPQTLPAEPMPPVLAPVVALPGDDRDRAGILDDARAEADSRGSGTGGGTGSGAGTGMGEGDGPGIGPGSGGGTGGGPYRPGSGVEPPTVLREVRPTYTDQARVQGITGVVVLEIVVRHDGAVGQVRVVDGLGWGLDERAIEAVRQWRFAPARRKGVPVDVLVEVEVEFRLR